MQKARRHPHKWRLRPLLSAWFQGLFTPLLGVLFTFPSRYSFTIGLLVVFSLAGWCRPFHTGFLRSRDTQEHRAYTTLYVYRTFTSFGGPFQNPSTSVLYNYRKSYNPVYSKTYGLGSSAFARHYSQNHYCFLFLPVLRCFSSQGLLLNLTAKIFGLPHSDIYGSLIVCISP